MDSAIDSFHELLGFGELFDDQKFLSQRAPDIYPSSLLDAEFSLLDDVFACASGGSCLTKPIEEEEDVDIETVDDNVCANYGETLSTDYDTGGAMCKVPPDQDVSRSLFNLEGLGKLDDSFAEDYLPGTCGIEADDLDSLFQQFDNVSKAMDSQSAIAPQAALLPQQLSELPTGQTAEQLPKNDVWGCLAELTETPAVYDYQHPEAAAADFVSDPMQLSGDYFDQISDHIYCLTQKTDVHVKQEPDELVGSSDGDAEITVCQQQHQALPMRPAAIEPAGSITILVGAATQQHCAKSGDAASQGTNCIAKTNSAKSLLRPNATTAKQATTAFSTNTLQAAIYSATMARSSSSCPSRPVACPSTRKVGALSSTATTSQSSSDSGSDSERSGTKRRQSRTGYHSSSGLGCSSRERRRYRSRSSSSSSHSSRSRSRSRSRSPLQRSSSRQRHEREKQEDKQRAMAERRVVYVGNIPNNFTKTDLRRRFSGFGEIEDVSVHFRDRGDNYGFVTFADSCDAYAAIEKGNDVPGRQFKLCFGGRRIFCETEYADLDGCAAVKEEWALRSCRRRDDFESLLKQTMSRIKKK